MFDLGLKNWTEVSTRFYELQGGTSPKALTRDVVLCILALVADMEPLLEKSKKTRRNWVLAGTTHANESFRDISRQVCRIVGFDNRNDYLAVNYAERGVHSYFSSPTETAFPWLKEIINAGLGEPSIDLVTTQIIEIDSLMSQRNFASIDILFETLPVAKINSASLVAFVRATFSIRSQLTKWAYLLQTIREELQSRGINSEDVLQGLH